MNYFLLSHFLKKITPSPRKIFQRCHRIVPSDCSCDSVDSYELQGHGFVILAGRKFFVAARQFVLHIALPTSTIQPASHELFMVTYVLCNQWSAAAE